MKAHVKLDIPLCPPYKQWGRVVIVKRLHQNNLANGEQISWNVDYKQAYYRWLLDRLWCHTRDHSTLISLSIFMITDLSVFWQIKRAYVHRDMTNINK
jgi:hypothetical protein